MHRLSASMSRWLNRVLGGRVGETLCGRACRLWGHDCLACRIIGFVLRDPWHCLDMRIWEIRNRR